MRGFGAESRGTLGLVVLGALCLLAFVAPARGQLDAVKLSIDHGFVGLAGHVRPGTWTPMRLNLKSLSAQSRAVVCRWLSRDKDGDRVISRREVALTPNREQKVWLYADPPAGTSPATPWNVQVLDADTGRLLASAKVAPDPAHYLHQRASAIGMTGVSSLGLTRFTSTVTRHEPTSLVMGLSLDTLPDRWYGLSLLRALIWTPAAGGDPDDAAVTAPIRSALRGWVRRGGHLVIVWPTVGPGWLGSGLGDMLPFTADQVSRVDGYPPDALGAPQTGERAKIRMSVFDIEDESAGAPTRRGGPAPEVIDRNRAGRPVVVARRYGVGRVTVIGVDLSSRPIKRMGLPQGRFNLWNDVFGWQSPAFSKQYIQSEIHQNHIVRPSMRPTPIPLGQFIPSQIAMRNTATPALFAAAAVFVVYWLLAGPVAYFVLARRKALGFSWLVFLGVVGVFTAVCWGGAVLLRPGVTHIAHFTVLTGDAASGEVHAHSWLSLFVPRFGDARIRVDPARDRARSRDTLASPGLPRASRGGGFLDPQSYVVHAASPGYERVPMRATAKQFQVDYHGRIGRAQPGLSKPWVLPHGKVHLENFWPVGSLTHHLPGPLTGVWVVYCPGGNQTPFVWRKHGPWPPGTAYAINRQPAARRLVRRPANGRFPAKRSWVHEGMLGTLIGLRTGQRFANLDKLQVAPADNEIIQSTQMLSFYDMMPPPNFRDTHGIMTGRSTTYLRRVGRALDLSPLTAGRRLIVIGYLRPSPLPIPMTVNGQTPKARGWTMVRTIIDLPAGG